MDIAAKLRETVNEVPPGDHSAGLSAIVRHVEAAIRHYNRGEKGDDEDAFTDCIYRTNQVYEGSLKESYRITAGKDPEKKTLHDIEKYFDNEGQIRSKVMAQMTRYRLEYRNPYTHDYKLDSDANEALLAIMSVCGFATLLASQMKLRIDANTLRNDPGFKPETKVRQKSDDAEAFAEDLALSIQKFMNEDAAHLNLGTREPVSLVGAFLDQGGLSVVRNLYVEVNGEGIEWDMIVTNKSGFKVPIEVITSRGRYSPAIAASRINHVKTMARASGYATGILVEGASFGSQYECARVVDEPGLILHRVGRPLTSEEVDGSVEG